jgi:uncharacterized protein (DUF736 family)
MIIGIFTKDEDGAFSGSIATLTFSEQITFYPVEAERPDIPDYHIKAWHGLGDEHLQFDVGVAWKRTSKKGNAYISVKLDDPALPQPIHCALRKIEKSEQYVLHWSRTDPRKVQSAGQAPDDF